MLVFNKSFYKNKKSKLYFGDRVAVLNDFIYQTGESMKEGGFFFTWEFSAYIWTCAPARMAREPGPQQRTKLAADRGKGRRLF
jgi:hypothetical protein